MQVILKSLNKIYLNKLKIVVGKIEKKTLIIYSKQNEQVFRIKLNLNLA